MQFINLIKDKKVIIWDGGMGTSLAMLESPKSEIPNSKCNEELNLIAPDLIKSVHLGFLEAGSQVIETNTFGANRIVLAEHGLEHKVREINIAAVKIAKESSKTQELENSRTQKLFIAGSIGPTSKLPTLGHISFNEMVEVYKEQVVYLLEAGVDILQIETCQDILQAKAAVVGCMEASRRLDVSACVAPERLDVSTPASIPIIVTVTIEASGTTLLGSEITAILSALLPFNITAFGLNCATGPAEMEEHIRQIRNNFDIPIAVRPNAGLPEIKNGAAHYPLGPDEFASHMKYFVEELGVQIVGGCCGTTPKHIRAIVERFEKPFPKKDLSTYPLRPTRLASHLRTPQISSLYSATPIDQQPPPLIVGERMNINGSKEFREFILANNYDAAAQMAKRQVDSGAHVLDLSVAYAGRDEIKDINEMAKRLATISTAPLMIDSTNPAAIEAALSHLGGRSIINSINLEDGGKKAKEILKIATRFGAGVVALTIDEEGMAYATDKKVLIAKRLVDLMADYVHNSSNLILFIDPLTFTLADPKAAEFGSGEQTLKAIRQISTLKKDGIAIRTILGVSNISYGLKPRARHILNSVFLNEAIKASLSAAIVHPGQILPIHKIDRKEASLAADLIHCRHKECLTQFAENFEKREEKIIKAKQKIIPPDKALKNCIINGDKTSIKENIEPALKNTPPKEIINKILLPAMREVGELFGRGELVLPFVLKSAEVMREAIDFLSPHMEKSHQMHHGTIVLATVRGDVHDIGKNLVDIILSNNGYEVINLGVKQPLEAILKSAQENKADAIGLSGLLVQSCIVMKEDLAELRHRQFKIPVICGGAALTHKFVENELASAYDGPVYYAKDAFDGLKIMQEIKSA